MGGAFISRGGSTVFAAQERLMVELAAAERLGLIDVRSNAVESLAVLVTGHKLTLKEAQALADDLRARYPKEEGREEQLSYVAMAWVHS